MKSLIFLFAGFNTSFAFEPIFDSRSAFDRCLDWASLVPGEAGLVLALTPQTQALAEKSLEKSPVKDRVKYIIKDRWNVSTLLEAMSEAALKDGADTIVYSLADKPFIDIAITKEILKNHKDYLAEYSSCEGYPHGLAPEILNTGTAKILSDLSKENQKEAGLSPVTNDAVFSVIKGDVNAFEIETYMAPKDFRMMRFDFSCSSQASLLSCHSLYDAVLSEGSGDFSALNLSTLACKSSFVQKSLPYFYNIQLSKRFPTRAVYNPYLNSLDNDCVIDFKDYKSLVKKISTFSKSAVVGLGSWTDPLCASCFIECAEEVLSYPGLSLLVETTAVSVSEEELEAIAKKLSAYSDRITWIIAVDAFTSVTYKKIHGEDFFQKAVNSVSLLKKYFPSVYPQLTRMDINEEELESFYRFWHDAKSPSDGKVIIQKYDCVCGLLTDRRPADLSPLERVPCWHIKRDMTILCSGDVPLCRECFDSPLGNVFKQPIEEVWEKSRAVLEDHIKNIYNEKCGKCDEYYTFNF